MSLGDSKFERIFPIPEIVVEFGLFTNRASVIGSLGEPGKKAAADLPAARPIAAAAPKMVSVPLETDALVAGMLKMPPMAPAAASEKLSKSMMK